MAMIFCYFTIWGFQLKKIQSKAGADNHIFKDYSTLKTILFPISLNGRVILHLHTIGSNPKSFHFQQTT
ncbi:unnamed protein product [Cuscuta campestris]|uniref:Uncharacterized protein n=1 Tax=Cuscuta campestris TaxID=132261 RepID=A0A484LKZ7_9ASTE|nr:unnamed protein product [Cuscuta campestris]